MRQARFRVTFAETQYAGNVQESTKSGACLGNNKIMASFEADCMVVARNRSHAGSETSRHPRPDRSRRHDSIAAIAAKRHPLQTAPVGGRGRPKAISSQNTCLRGCVAGHGQVHARKRHIQHHIATKKHQHSDSIEMKIIPGNFPCVFNQKHFFSFAERHSRK